MEFGLKGSYAEFLYVGKLETEQGPATIRLGIDTLIANILVQTASFTKPPRSKKIL